MLYLTATPVDGELLKEGKDVTLKCVVDGIQTYHTIWQRNGEKLEGERYEISQQDKEQILTIKKASEYLIIPGLTLPLATRSSHDSKGFLFTYFHKINRYDKLPGKK